MYTCRLSVASNHAAGHDTTSLMTSPVARLGMYSGARPTATFFHHTAREGAYTYTYAPGPAAALCQLFAGAGYSRIPQTPAGPLKFGLKAWPRPLCKGQSRIPGLEADVQLQI